jgi:hypothetical protein
MLIQVAINNIESIDQGEEILKKWHYHLDEDQSHVVVERDVDGVTVRISRFHPWADEMEEDDEGDDQDEEAEGDDEDEESEVMYLGQALFVPAGDQARVLANELMDDDYIGTISVSMAGVELTDTDAFSALPADMKDAVIAAIEELGDAEAYLSMYEVMGLKD